MSLQRFGCHLSLLLLIATLGTGCVTNGRRVLLKEYGPSVPTVAGGALNGVTICLKGFTCAPSLIALEEKSEAEEPSPFAYMDMPRNHDKTWDTEMKSLQKNCKDSDLKEIGNMRNGFGMVMSHVYVLNDPAVWLADSLKYDLEAQGAKVVDASQAGTADVTVSGTIQLCRTDMYMTVNGDLVVDLEVQPKEGELRKKRIHTHGATAAFLASEGEYFHSLRDARQKFSLITMRQIEQALKRGR